MKKKTFEVRIRDADGIKKSRFYRARGPREAALCYDGPGFIMWVNKVSHERKLGVREYRVSEQGVISERRSGMGAFLKLGDDLIRQIQQQEQQEMKKAKEQLSK